MKNKYFNLKKSLLTMLFCLMAVFAWANPTITNVQTVGNCKYSGTLTVSATGDGTLFYEIKLATETDFHSKQASNVFAFIPVGTYNIRVTDNAGSTVGTSYTVPGLPSGSGKIMTFSNPEITSDVTTCTPGGRFVINFNDGIKPYDFYLTNTSTREVFSKLGSQASSNITFTDLPDGLYLLKTVDACGTEYYVQNVKIDSRYNVDGKDFETFKWEGPVTYGTDAAGSACGVSITHDRTYVYLTDTSGEVLFKHGSTTQMPATYPLPTAIEYPAESGNITTYATGVTHYISAAQYRPSQNMYTIWAQNPCNPDDLVSYTDTLPYPYDYRQTVCGYGLYRYMPTYNCGDVTIEVFNQVGTRVFTQTVLGSTGFQNLDFSSLPYGTYSVFINIAGAAGGTGDRYQTKDLIIGSNSFLDVGMIVHNPLSNCKFTLGDLMITNIPSNNEDLVTYRIIEGPQLRESVTSTTNGLLWAGLPRGVYKIEISRGLNGVCGVDTITMDLVSPYSGFATNLSFSGGYLCGSYRLNGSAWFTDTAGNVAETEEPYSIIVTSEPGGLDPETIPSRESGASFSTDVDMLPDHEYRLLFQNPTTECIYLDTIIRTPIPQPLNIDIGATGGIICPSGFGTLHIAITGGVGNTISYRLWEDGEIIRGWQSSPNFPGLQPGTYVAEIDDFCETDAENVILDFSSAESVITITGSTCQQGSATLTVTADAEVQNAIWLTPRGTLTGSSITINNLSLADAGNYIVTFDAGECTWKDTAVLTVNSKPEFAFITDTLSCGAVLVDLTNLPLVSGSTTGLTMGYYNNSYQTLPIPNAVPTGIYHIVGTNLFGCIDTSHITVGVFPNATPGQVTASGATICTGDSTTLTATAAVDVTGPVYSWYASQTSTIPIATSQTLNTGKLTTSLTRDTVFYVSVSGGNFCENAIESRTAVTVRIQQMPTLDIIVTSGDSNNLCHNSTIGLQAVLSNGTATWQRWYDINGRSGNDTCFNPTDELTTLYDPTSLEAGTTSKIYVRVSDLYCGYLADTIRLRIMPLPTAAKFEIVTEPISTQDMCVDTVYELKVKSSDMGILKNISLKFDDEHATGITVIGAEVKNPYTAATWQTLNLASEGLHSASWNLPDSLKGGDSLLVRVTVSARCERIFGIDTTQFFSGSSVFFDFNATSACSDPMGGQRLETDKFYTKQDLSLVNTYDISGTFTANSGVITTVTNNTGDTVTWKIKTVIHGGFPIDSERETMVFLVPAGLTLIEGSYNAIRNASSTYDTLVDETGVEYEIELNENIQDGDSVVVEIKFHAAGSACEVYSFYSEIVYADTAYCGVDPCIAYSTRGSYYPKLEVERYTFSLADTVRSYTLNDLWYGNIKIRTGTQFFAGDSIHIDFYLDRNKDFQPDTLVHSYTHITADVADSATFMVNFNEGVYIEQGKQLLAVIRGDALCTTTILPVATIMGVDTICQSDTVLFYTTAYRTDYKYNVIKPDAISGATAVRIPLVGSTAASYAADSIVRIVFPKQGEFTVWTQYSIPTAEPGVYHQIDKTYIDVHVNQRPVMALVSKPDTTICEGSQVELSHFFKDTTGVGTLSYYKKEINGDYTLLIDQIPLIYVEPWDTTTYRAVATADTSGCQSLNAVDFRVNVNKMPLIGTLKVNAQPNCQLLTGSIAVSVSGGSGAYEYSLYGFTFDTLPANGIIGGLDVNDYRVYVRDTTRRQCVAISELINLNPANSGLYVEATTINTTNCGSNNGTIQLSVNGGVGPYTYLLNDQGSYKSVPPDGGIIGTNFDQGTYRILVKDANNCSATAGEVVVKATAGLNLTLTQAAPANCNINGLVNISVTNGTQPYSFKLTGGAWVPMSGSFDSTRIAAGLHEIFVKDSSGCETSDTISIGNTTGGPSVALNSVSDATCNGLSGGNINFTATGGTGLKYSLDGGKTYQSISAGANTISGLAKGYYQVLIADGAGCTTMLQVVTVGLEPDFIQAKDNHYYTYVDMDVEGNLIQDDYDLRQSGLTLVNIGRFQHGSATTKINGDFKYKTVSNFVGIDSAQYAARNACGLISNAWLYIHINDLAIPANRPPAAMDDYYSTKINQTKTNFEVRANDTDPDGDLLQMPTVISQVSRGALTQNPDGTFNYDPDTNFVGVDEFTYKVCDNNDSCSMARVFITVLSDTVAENFIVALPDVYSVARYDTLKVLAASNGILNNDTYPVGSTLGITLVDSTNSGKLTVNPDGAFTYTPDVSFSGNDHFVYLLCATNDPTVKCDTAWVNIFVIERTCPTPVVLAIQDTLIICLGDSVDLNTAILSASTNIDTVTFFTGSSFDTPVTNPFVKAQGYYLIKADNIYECSTFDTVFVRVRNQANSANVTARDTTICTNNSAVLTATAVGITGVPVYRWYESQTSTIAIATSQTLNTGILTTATTRDTVFYVSVTGDNLCENLTGSRTAVTVRIQQMPTVEISADKDTNNLCHNSLITLTATLKNGSGSSWENWYDKNGADKNGDQYSSYDELVTNYDPELSEAGSTTKLFVRVSDMVCGYMSDTIYLRILPLPTVAKFEIVSQPLTPQVVCTDTVYELKITSSNMGALTNMKVTLSDDKQTGLSVQEAYIKQPYLATNWDTLSFTDSTILTYSWELPDSLSAGDSILVRIRVAAGCDFTSGSNVDFLLNAKSVCGDSVPQQSLPSLKFNTDQDTSNMHSFDISGTFTTSTSVVTNVMTNNTGDTVTWHIKSFVHGSEPTDSTKEYMAFLIPKGLTYVEGSYSNIINAAPIGDLIELISDTVGDEFSFPIVRGLTEGDSIEVEVKFLVTGASCETYKFYSEIIYIIDSITCGDYTCGAYYTRGGYYPELEVERYTFSLTDSVYSYTLNDLWYGNVKIRTGTQFFAGDSIFIDFYLDRDRDFVPDTLVHSYTHITTDIPALDTFSVSFTEGVYIEQGKQLLAVIRGDALCTTTMLPVATIMGDQTVCEFDTVSFYTTAGQLNYKYNTINPDGISGATPVARVPLVGSTASTYATDSIVRIVFRKASDYKVWTQYSVPTTQAGVYHQIDKTYIDVHVNQRPVMALVSKPDTTICEGSQVELSHFFRDTTGVGTLSYSMKGINGEYIPLINQMPPIYVDPRDTTIYRAFATADTSGCQSLNAVEFRVNVNRKAAINSTSIINQPTCSVNSGSIQFNVSGGSGSYEYNFNGSNFYRDLPPDQTISNLPLGTYILYLHDKTQLACPISVSDPISFSPLGSSLAVTSSVTKTGSCSDSTGTIQLMVEDGVRPYSYKIEQGDTLALPQNGIIETAFAAGKYHITVYDASGCGFAVKEVEIQATSGLTLTLTPTQAAECGIEGKTATFVSGGVAPYTYKIDELLAGTLKNPNDTIALFAGLHTITVSDVNGCETQDTITISLPNSELAVDSVKTTPASCDGLGGGSITLYIKGTSTPLYWSMKGEKDSTLVTGNVVTLPNLATGNYDIRLSDTTGCVFSYENITVDPLKESGITLGTLRVGIQPGCGNTNGAIKLVVSGGSGLYDYRLSETAEYEDFPTDSTIRNLGVGEYTVSVRDREAPSCPASESNTISLDASNSSLQVTATPNTIQTCGSEAGGDGKIHLHITGGTGSYQYKLRNDSSYAVIPTDDTIRNLASGIYFITVRDSSGASFSCTATTTAVIEVQSSSIGLLLTKIADAKCGDTLGTVSISVTNSVTALYQLDGKDWRSFDSNPVTENLIAGSHRIWVKDYFTGCITSDSILINNTTANLQLTVSGSTSPTCTGTGGGSVRLNISGGTAPYTYSSGTAFSGTISAAGDFTISGMSAGIYKVEVIDANGCAVATGDISISRETGFVKAVDDYLVTYVGMPVSGNLLGNDYDYKQSPITISGNLLITARPVLLSVDTNGNFIYNPGSTFVGIDSVQYTVVNACGFTSNASLYITILDTTTTVNRSPVALPNHYETKVNTLVTGMDVRINDIDPDGDVLTLPTVISGVSNGTLAQNGGGTFDYTPKPGFVGVDKFTYSVCDPSGLCDTAKVFISVYSDSVVNNFIVALPDAYAVAKYDTLKITTKKDGILNNDIYQETQTPNITVLTQPTHGALTVSDSGKFIYTPNLHYYGPDYFIYRICSSNSTVGCDTAIVNIIATQGDCPDVVVPVMADTLTVCMNDSVDLYTAIDFTGSENVDTVLFYTDRGHSALLANNTVKTQGWYYAKALSINECEANDSVFVKVNALSAGGAIADASGICTGTQAGILTLKNYTGSITNWQNSIDGSTWMDIADTKDSTTLNPGILTQTTYYRVIVQSGVCGSVFSAVDTVQVNRYATSADITAENDTVCYGTSATLAVSSPKGTIKWYAVNDPSGTLLHTGDTLRTTNLFSDTLFYVSVKNDTLCENEASSLKEVLVKVNTLPTVLFAAVDLCANSTEELTAITSATTPKYTWSCTQDVAHVQALQSDSSHAILTPDAAGTCITICNVEDRANGCVNSFSATNQIYTVPESRFSYEASSTNSFDIQFADSSAIVSGTITSRSWNFGDGDTSAIQNPIHLYTAPGEYDVTLIVETDLGCTDTIMQTLEVIIQLIPAFTIADSVQCNEGNNFVFTDMSEINGTATDTAYFWNFGDGQSSSMKNPTHSYITAGTYNVKLVVSINGDIVQDSITKQVIVKPTPVLISDTNSGSICSGELFEYGAVSSVAVSNITWSRTAIAGINNDKGRMGMDNVISEQLTNSTANPIDVVYTFAMIADECNSSNQTVRVTVNPLPQVSAMPVGAYTSITGTDTIQMMDNNTAGSRTATINDPSIADINFDAVTGLIKVTGKKKGNTEIVYTSISAEGCETQMIIPVSVEGRPTGILVGKDVIVCNEKDGVEEIVQIAYILGGVAPWHVVISDDKGNTYDTVINALDDLPVNVTVRVPENTLDVPQFTNYTITLVEDAFNSNRETHYGRVRIGLNPTPRIDNIANKYQTVCAGQPTLPVSFKGVSTLFRTSIDKNIGAMNYDKDGIQSFIAINNGTQPDTATIVVIPEYWYNAVVCLGEPDTAFIIVNPIPTVDFSTQLTGIGEVTFTGISPDATTYSWNFGDGQISTAVNPVNTYAQSGTYTVTLTATNANGCSSTISKQVTVSITVDMEAKFNVASAVQCLSDNSFVFQNTSKITTPNHSISSWKWYFGDGDSSSVQNPTHVYASVGTYTVTLTITETPGGTQASYSQTVTVLDKPVVAIKAPAAICEGNKLSVPAPVIDWKGNTPVNGTWLLNGVIFDLNTVMTASDNGKMLQYRVTSTCGDTIPEVEIIVYANPVADFTTAVSGLGKINFTNTSSNATTYSWNFGDGSALATTKDATHTYAQSGTYTVTLTVTSVGGCKSTISKQVTVSTTTDLEAKFNVAPAVQCLSGNSFAFQNISKISTQGYSISTYSWNFGDNSALVTSKDATYTYPKVGTYTVTLTVTEAPGGTKSSYSQTVTVLDKPVVVLTAPVAICEGNKLPVVAPVIDWKGNTPVNGTWLLNGNIFDLNTVMTASDNGKQLQYRVTSTCGDATSAGVTITVNANPVMSNILDAVYCSGTQVSSMVFMPQSQTYQWKQTGKNIGLNFISGTDSIPAFKAINTGSQSATAYFEVTPFNGTCKGNTVSYSITVNPEIKLIGSLTADSLCSNNTFEYVATSTTPNVSYTWNRPAIAGINNGMAKSGNGAVISEVLVNNTANAITVTYNITLQEGNCPNTEAVTVVVKPSATVTLTNETKVCQNETTVSIECENNIPGLAVYYKISYDAKSLENGFQNMSEYVLLTGNSIEISLPSGLTPQRYAGTVSIKTMDCPNATTYNFGITVMSAATITEQPVSSMELCEGDASLSLSVKAEGSSLTYQWYLNGNTIAGATQSTYNKTGIEASDYGAYTVKVTGDCGIVTSQSSQVKRNEIVILQKWDDVLFVSRRDSTGAKLEFKSYQWYRVDSEGKMTAIAEKGNSQYYTEEGILGTFVVKVVYADDNYQISCPYTLIPTKTVKCNIYPNPAKANERINVELVLGEDKVDGSTIEVYDILGRRRASVTVTSKTTELYMNVATGTYLLRVTDPQGKAIKEEKVIIK